MTAQFFVVQGFENGEILFETTPLTVGGWVRADASNSKEMPDFQAGRLWQFDRTRRGEVGQCCS